MGQPDSHFHMSDRYAEHSSSQEDIGNMAIKKAVSMLRQNCVAGDTVKVLDVACGPGNLTCDLLTALATELPDNEFEVIGLDYSEENVKRLVARSRRRIQGLVGSFFDESLMPQGEDLIFSNEGLHWQPPFEMSEIVYSHLDEELRAEYEIWAVLNLEIVLRNIHHSLSSDGVAVLQFGREGQLGSLWKLVKEVLEQPQFLSSKRAINFPLFYPNLKQITSALQRVGFQGEDKIEVDAFNQDLVEDTPGEIAAFFRAFSESAFRRVMDEQTLEAFYAEFKN